MKRSDVLLSKNALDVNLGLLIYSAPEVYVGEYVRDFIPNPLNFQVREVGLNGLPASTSLCISSNEYIRCKKGEVLLYVLCKEYLSTLEAIDIVRRLLKVRHVGYAGLKDTSASTCQYITIKCESAKELPVKVSKHIDVRRKLILCFIGESETVLKRGYLNGNEFIVKLQVESRYEDEIIHVLRNNLNNALFLNYFGYQRFGTLRPYNHIIGKLILESKYEEALEYIVGKPTIWESSEARKARRLFEEGKLKEAFNKMPKHLDLERRVLTLLLKGLKPKDIIARLNRSILEIFIESFQSYVINLSLSKLYLMYGNCRELLGKCEVLPYPTPTINTYDICSEVVKDTLRSVVDDVQGPFSKYLRRGFRETVVAVKDIHISYNGGILNLRFRLPPSAYATVILRELLRSKLKVQASSYPSGML